MLKINNLSGLYFHKNKVVMFLSKYEDFKQLTSTQKILDELLSNYNEKFLEKMGLNTTKRIKNFLIKNEIEVVDVIAYFENNRKSKPIIHHPHTFYENAMEVINTHLETGDDSLYDNYRLNELIGSNIINNIIKNGKEITKKVKIAILEGLDKIYEDMNNKDVQNDLKREIEYVDRIKRKFSSGKNEENLPTNIMRMHNKWKEEITQKAIESCPDINNIFNIINESKILEESEA
ncbi:hypothetical protein H3C61_00480 [Candidatus Gracilibacteria bacterium]|nr:hypothetical protein [Candidatus Gracilibacteria bacterium]